MCDRVMDSVKQLTKISYWLEKQVDRLWFDREIPYDKTDVLIVPYRWYGTDSQLELRGRLLHNKDRLSLTADDSFWRNFWHNYRRFYSNELPNIPIIARWEERFFDAITDEEGYFSFKLPVTQKMAQSPYQKVSLSVHDTSQKTVEGRVYVPSASAEFGIISDIDDTILISHATVPLKMALLTFMGNAYSRRVFEGVPDFYRALHQQRNPIFYVSSSPWNIYDFLLQFIEINRLPEGPLCLQELGIDQKKLIMEGNIRHKLEEIGRVFATYPTLKFLLLGDSGQNDPEIYDELAKRFPEQVLGIMIRDVTKGKRDASVEKLVIESDVPFLFFHNTAEAYRCAVEWGLVSAEAIE